MTFIFVISEINLSREKQVATSALWSDVNTPANPEQLVTDGIYTQNEVNKCTHTNTADMPYIRIDLGSSAYVHKIKIWPRTDCGESCLNMYTNLTFGVGNVTGTDTNDPPVDCATYIGPPTSVGEVITVQCNKMTRRYVYMKKDTRSALSVCEFEVLGKFTGKCVIIQNKLSRLFKSRVWKY